MDVERELGRHSPAGESVLTIGVFDGVHRGHGHLLSRLVAKASNAERLAGVVTFRNHPASVLKPGFKPRYLASVGERLRLIKEHRVDFVVPITFDQELSKLRAADFAALLQKHLRMKGLVIGPDFAMGHNREGDPETLASIGREMGFSVLVVDPLVDDQGHAVRSTTVREALSRGDLLPVAQQMGRNFSLEGTVVRGQGRGGPLGFPTANLEPPEGMAVPGDGIYATWAEIGSQRYMAASSIGVRPTFEDGDRAIEAFVLDFDGDLYGQLIRLEFVRRLRDEVKFDSVESLKEQVDKDVDETKAALKSSE